MPAVSVNSAITSGHSQFPPTTVIATAATVFVNKTPVLRVGDMIVPHARLVIPFDVHPGKVNIGSSTVFAEGKAIARIGDTIECGDTIALGSSNVFAN